MGLLGSGWDDPQSQGLLALASGMISGNFGKGVADMNSTLAGAQDVALKRKLMQAQIGNLDSEVLNRQAAIDKQKNIQELFRDLTNPNARFAENTAGAQPGQAGSGTMDPANFQPNTSRPAGGLNLSPEMLLRAKALGLDLVEIAKYARPDMQVSGGYAYDKNNLKPGFLPQLNTSQNGQTSMVQIGKDGQPFVSAPRGALDAYSAYRKADEGVKADYTPTTVTPQGQSPQITTVGNLLRNPQVAGTQIPPAVQAARDADRQAILATELSKAQGQLKAAIASGDQSAAARAQADIAALSREMGGKSPSIGMPLQSDEEKLRATKGVEGDANESVARAKDVKTAQKFLSVVGKAEGLLNDGPTNSGIGSIVDSGAAFFGKALPGAVTAEQLKALGGWLVSNVPRMEGPQSNFDVANYQTMAANVGNDKLPIATRKAALESIKAMMQQTIDGGGQPKPSDSAPAKSFKDFGYKDQAAALRDAQNTIMRNPSAKPEVMRRLKNMGIDLNGGSW